MSRPPPLPQGLQSLSLSDNKVGNKGAQALADMVRTTATLQKLILSGNSIRSAGASQLVAALSQNSSLKQLFLANVRGGAEGGALWVVGQGEGHCEGWGRGRGTVREGAGEGYCG